MKPEKPFATLIVGLGNIGLGYDLSSHGDQIFSHTKACLAHQAFELVAGIDPDRGRRQEFTKFANRETFDSLDNTPFQPGEIDLVIISTPTSIRLEVVEKALALRPRAILLEKPLASSVREAEQIVALCRQHQVLLAVNYFRNFDPKTQEVLNFARQHGCESLRAAACYYSGGILNSASHYIALLVQWFGPPAKVIPLGIDASSAAGDAKVSFRMVYGEADVVFTNVEAEYGIGEVDLLFDRGRVRFENYGEDAYCYQSAADPYYAGYCRLALTAGQPERPALDRYQYYPLEAIAQALRQRDDSHLCGEIALQVLKICEEVVREAKSPLSGT